MRWWLNTIAPYTTILEYHPYHSLWVTSPNLIPPWPKSSGVKHQRTLKCFKKAISWCARFPFTRWGNRLSWPQNLMGPIELFENVTAISPSIAKSERQSAHSVCAHFATRKIFCALQFQRKLNCAKEASQNRPIKPESQGPSSVEF